MNRKQIHNGLEYLKILSSRSSQNIESEDFWRNSLIDPSSFYLDAFRYFYFKLPRELKTQKRYFRKESRGFGENAFHSMWYLLYEKFKFRRFLEIGVYRGQVMHLIGLLAKLAHADIEIYGISPFDNTGDLHSHYLSLDYQEDVLNHFRKFSLMLPKLIKAYSTDKVALELISSHKWDCIYIDGSHDLEIVKQDWQICKKHIKVGGIIVLDDASLYTNFNPPFFAFKGHPGPSEVADSIVKHEPDFAEILRIGHNRVFQRLR